MNQVVLDASVVLKWFIAAEQEVADSQKALCILQQVEDFRLQVVQPGHWIFEVAAVLARLSPETATRDIHELLELNFVQLQTPELLLQASELSIELRHHLFDTLYHAVALALPDTRLITADVKYFHKAKHKGCLTLLQDFAADSNLA